MTQSNDARLHGRIAERGRPKRRSSAGPTELPTFYYHAHFVEMLQFVGTHYAHVLSDADHQFRRCFGSLSFPAQCLYVRLVNRRGRLFSTATLRYEEITDLNAALSELHDAGFVHSPDARHLGDMLHLLTRPQLAQALKAVSVPFKSSAKKADLVDLARAQVSPEHLFDALPTSQIVVQGHFNQVRFLLYLFFGQLQDGLSQFTMRDLGLVRTQDPEGGYEARFAERDDAVQAFYFASALDALAADTRHADVLFQSIDRWPKPQAPVVADLRDQLALGLGKLLESNPDAALQVYSQGESVHCTERSIRLLLSSGRREQAKEYLERCIESPTSDDEALLASDIYARKFNKKRTSALTDLLRKAPIIDIDDAYRGSPEWGSVRHFEKLGRRAFRAENRFWRTLFGLLFWDLLFEGETAGTQSPFERLPAALIDRRFVEMNKAAIDQRLALLTDRKAAKRQLLQTAARYFGQPNGVFRWRQSTLDAINAFIDVAPPEATSHILHRFCDDYMAAKHGYPDLLVIDGDDLRFIEIKSDGDQLRRNQMLRLKQLQDAGFKAEVMRVRWVLDPTQAYVVVDVETTGGKGATHRVTEVGAVKVIGDTVIDTFHTLINPERSIPPGITRLTGITHDMVADAPVFAEIADEFAAFCEDAIFVAHNVEFDYGFIAAEFERLGRHFRRPKLCTCASMRKLAPGKDSYGLAALSAHYNIALDTHHRALCDAQAAAELLLIVNDKRREQLEVPR